MVITLKDRQRQAELRSKSIRNTGSLNPKVATNQIAQKYGSSNINLKPSNSTNYDTSLIKEGSSIFQKAATTVPTANSTGKVSTNQLLKDALAGKLQPLKGYPNAGVDISNVPRSGFDLDLIYKNVKDTMPVGDDLGVGSSTGKIIYSQNRTEVLKTVEDLGFRIIQGETPLNNDFVRVATGSNTSIFDQIKDASFPYLVGGVVVLGLLAFAKK